ncbi:MAG: FAD-dependent oxidoreductase [Lentisphaeria bacterium]|nr:FAD-dependent oxidoreductase [Lentisphaeria bacterium]
MNSLELKRTVALDDSWDVIVVGGGPSGCTAATAAAREGARTLLIEATGALGGMGTQGLVPAWCPFSDGERILYGGLAERVFTECKAGMRHVRDEAIHGHIHLDPELLKRIYDDLVCETGAEVLLHTMLCDVNVDEQGGVTSILVANKAGLHAYSAKVYVDGTGDGDLSVWAGAEYETGDEKGVCQPATHCFVLSNVDAYEYQHGPNLYAANSASPVWAILKSGRHPFVKDDHMCTNLIGPGTVGFNAGHIWDVDTADPRNMTAAMMEGRRIAAGIQEALAEFHPRAFAGSYLAATAPLMGIRETRRIVGDYVLTQEDYFARRSFSDEIGRNCYAIDIHTAKDEVEKVKREQKIVVAGRFERYARGESHGVPYRCLLPKGLRNVLIAGRSISTDRVVQASTRVMPVCLMMGEAAGMAAAHAVECGGDVRAIDVQQLRHRLREEGGYLPEV